MQRQSNNTHLYLERVKLRDTSRIAEVDLPSVNEIEMRIDADKGNCTFLYKLQGANWETLAANADATIISFSVPDGLFLGATVGPHVRIDQ